MRQDPGVARLPTEPRTDPDEPVQRDGIRVRLREATLADADVVDGRSADPAMWGEFNDFGMPRPPTLAENLANGKRMVAPDRGQLLIERIEDGTVMGDVG